MYKLNCHYRYKFIGEWDASYGSKFEFKIPSGGLELLRFEFNSKYDRDCWMLEHSKYVHLQGSFMYFFLNSILEPITRLVLFLCRIK